MRSNKGFSLVELMVAMLILTTGVVGSIAIQSHAKKNSFDAIQRAQATALAHDIIERMRGNKTQLASYAGTDFGSKEWSNVTLCHRTTTTTNSVSCTPEQLATYDIYQWDQAIRGGHVTKTVTDDNGDSTIKIGGLINPTGCIVITPATNAAGSSNLTGAGSVTVVVSWQGRFGTKDANVASGNNCGGSDVDKKRREVSMTAYIF
ncbi:type IV pilus modification protein PilV [Algibacillus agarilyticus]|uniref:type IV pilus modification protein PilV n=1 Tax=Algibacillus agarilyticus TaxID=2234133 RepID=UPI000DD073CB|nr:type IV pilus modification protein PilV [Algibacillus agarilyticus]